MPGVKKTAPAAAPGRNRNQTERGRSGWSGTNGTAVDPGEATHLLASGGGGGPTTTWTWRELLLNRTQTPGLASEQAAVRAAARIWHVLKVTLLSSYVNCLLVMVPVGIVAGAANCWGPAAVFSINFLAIIPLAAVLAFATECVSAGLGDTLGGLLNATFGNAVELIVSVVALREGQIQVVQASMLGSILSNLLLVMGMCFFIGGVVNMNDSNGQGREQIFADATAQTTCSLLTLASASLVIPASLYALFDSANSDKEETARSILILSRGTAIILLALYMLYLWFQLRTHPNLFGAVADVEAAVLHGTTSHAGANPTGAGPESEPMAAPMGVLSALVVLVVTTVLVSICADYLVGSIDALVATSGLSKAFIGLVLIPIVGNAAEHVTAVMVAIRNNMDLALAVAIGSSVQIALLVTPFLVIVGWAIGQPMTLHFETFETTAFVLSVLVVTYTVQDGKSNYLEGAMLMGLYLIIALAFYATPASIIDAVVGIVLPRA